MKPKRKPPLKRPDNLYHAGFKTVVEVTEAEFHTPLITFLRKHFGRDAAFSAFGYGYHNYDAIAVKAPVRDVRKVLEGRKGVSVVKPFR